MTRKVAKNSGKIHAPLSWNLEYSAPLDDEEDDDVYDLQHYCCVACNNTHTRNSWYCYVPVRSVKSNDTLSKRTHGCLQENVNADRGIYCSSRKWRLQIDNSLCNCIDFAYRSRWDLMRTSIDRVVLTRQCWTS